MADSQPNSQIFSVRIVSIDYYMAPPIPDLDICYSSFQGGKVNEVPVIRIYGSTPAGQKACVHVHRALPYFYIPCSDVSLQPHQEGEAYMRSIFFSLERALKLKGSGASKRQHVHGCTLVRAKKLYGYHPEEELFVKIYFYHPHDVSRAANLLLGGEVLSRVLQPHEAHIPYILQFLVDYNLYGMGHLHLLKMRFRHPVPDTFPCSNSNYSGQQGEKSVDFTAKRSDAGSPIWICSSISPDWMWGFPGNYDASSGKEGCSFKRHSICELEGDATVQDIFNQQFKVYTSLSQTRSDVKMVQSLVPIWEEEYERTGMHEAALPPDPGKPLPENVLKILCPASELDNKLIELCGEAEISLTPNDRDSDNFQALASLLDEGTSVKLGCVDSNDFHALPLKHQKEKDASGTMSTEGLLPKEEVSAVQIEKGPCSKLLLDDKLEAIEVIGTADQKTADKEALQLLRWLATSQAAEELNSDDELAYETILSPLLPATTFDKVLEKASIDYESESQKECQDILDSIENFIDVDNLDDGASVSFENVQVRARFSEKNISQVDGSGDDPNSASCSRLAGNSFDIETKGELEWASPCRGCQNASASFTCKNNRGKPLWGSIPLSTAQKASDLESTDVDRNFRCISDSKDQVGTSCSDGSEADKCIDASAKSVDENKKELFGLAGCSVRDLMRRKRCHRLELHNSENSRAKRNFIEDEKEDMSRSCLHLLDDGGKETALFESIKSRIMSSDSQATDHGVCDVRPNCYNTTMNCRLPLTSISNSSSQASMIRGLNYGSHIGVEDGFCIGGTSTSINCSRTQLSAVQMSKKELLQDSEPKRQNPAACLCCSDNCCNASDSGVSSVEALAAEIYASESDVALDVLSVEFDSGNKVLADVRVQRVEDTALSCLPPCSIDRNISTGDSFVNNNISEVCKDGILEMSNKNNLRTDATVDMIGWRSEKFDTRTTEGDSNLSEASSIRSLVVNKNLAPAHTIGMTLCEKPPVVEWEGGACGISTICNHTLGVDNENYELPGRLHDIPQFFDGNCHGEGVQNKCYDRNDSKVRQDYVLGIPTKFQNDGSYLYLLTPMLSPPSINSVYKWLLKDETVTTGMIDEAMMESPSSKEKDLIASPKSCSDDCNKRSESYMGHIQDYVHQENYEKSNAEGKLSCIDASEVLHSKKDTTKFKTRGNDLENISQISGPEGASKLTPLSQLGFRDPASVGGGQQLTLLSLEVQAECRGDLRPDPRFDAINVICLAIQNDSDSLVDCYVLLRSNAESDNRCIDGVCSCNVFVSSEEKDLFSNFVKIVRLTDPDIMMGWDMQGASLGFLAERALHLGIGLLNKISRTPFEAKITSGDSEILDNEGRDILQHQSLSADTDLLQDAIIEDEWGRTHASGVHVGGRIVLNIWRLMRGEVKLNMYTVETVAEAVLRRKVPLVPHKVLKTWYSTGPVQARYRCIEYVMDRAKLNFEIMNQLDMINRTSELARVFGIDFFSVLSRGSQYRVESMLLRLAHSQNYLAISPGNHQVASQPAMECLPLVMEPESGFYADPVVVLDFQSLYPSMIIAYNLCFSTCLGKIVPPKPHILGVSSYSPEPHVLRKLKDQIMVTPNGVMYVPSKLRKGVLPHLLEEILSTRIMVKQAMKKLASSQQVLQKIFNARQLALKLIANVTYGYTAAGFSGRMPCAELADSIVQCGRRTLEKAISFVNAHDKWKAKVIYGDTDSMFVLLEGRSVVEAFQIGNEIASAITAMNPNPVTLKMEKVYHPCFLLTKKRYVGYSYESPQQSKPIFDAKGIETVRRDTCGAVSKMMEQSLRLYFEHQDLSEVKAYLQRQWTRILSGKASLQDFVFAKEVRLGTYSARDSSSLPPAAIVATKAMRTDPRAEPRYGERVPYAVIHGEPGARLVDMVVDPLDLLAMASPYRLNDIYYITKQIIPTLQRVFGLLGADLNQWFSEMPRPAREKFSKRISAQNSHRTRIDYYYLSKHCMLCGELVQASAHICNECSKNETAVAAALVGRTSKLERDMQHLAAICRHCGGGDWLVETGVKCKSLACSVFYERCKVQKELQGLSTVAADMGLYPKCMVEWF